MKGRFVTSTRGSGGRRRRQNFASGGKFVGEIVLEWVWEEFKLKFKEVFTGGGGREGGGEGGARTDGDATADSFRRRSSRTWEAISPCVFHSFLADSDDGEAAARVMLEDRFGVVVDDCCFG